MNNNAFQERRRYPRVKCALQVELRTSPTAPPIRAVTSEVSAGGCYIESMFTLPVGTKVSMVLWTDNNRLTAEAVVATCYPQVGNGIYICEMSLADRTRLNTFCQQQQQEAPQV